MGIVNLTPDSFSGDGVLANHQQAIDHARRQFEDGADILDLGAESSRPGASPTSESEEWDRLAPILEVVTSWGVPISVDTYKPAVMRKALAAGATMINDINALRAPGALQAVVDSDCAVCLMHMQGLPGTMQLAPHYQDVVTDVRDFLAARFNVCMAAGIAASRVVLDPGFGFGKTLEDNLMLFRALTAISVDDAPLLVGASRKSMLGSLVGRDVAGRLPSSIAAAITAVNKGAKIVRVHDVAATKDALTVIHALQ